MPAVADAPLVAVPSWVRDHDAYRMWARSDQFPEQGQFFWLGGALWVDAEGLRLKVPPQLVERVRAHAGKRIAIGVRPEALHLASGSDLPEYSFDTAVDVVEPLGNEILVNFRAGGAPMVARVDPAVRLKARQNIRVALDPERVHFFDDKSGAAI